MILVTGATGFLGRNLCEYLAQQGYPLRALARSSRDVEFLHKLGVEIAAGDVTDQASVVKAVQGCRQIIHTAAHFRLWGAPKDFAVVNRRGTLNLLTAAQQANIQRFIHISTIIVARPQASNQIIIETSPYNPYPTDYYARTKVSGEKLALSFAQKGLPLIVLRLGALYGPWGHYAFNRIFFEDFLYHGLRIQVHNGRHITFPCYVGDAVKAIEAALTLGQAGQIYNVSGESISHQEINRIVSRLAGKSTWRINIPAPLMINFARFLECLSVITQKEPYYPANLVPYVFEDWWVDSSKAHRELKFAPCSFKVGAQQTLAWYKAIGHK